MVQNKRNEERAAWHKSGSTNLEEVRSLDAIVCSPVWLNTTNIHNLDTAALLKELFGHAHA